MNTNARSAKAEARAESQRERILAAAQQCFIEHGFHGAGMASIAETAGMSAGLIYRYFDGKSAIILAIVERQLELLRNDIQLNRKIDLPSELAQNFGRYCASDGRGMSAPLLLEISAEATRDPQIAAALDRFDAALREAIRDWVTRSPASGGHGVAVDQAPKRALLLQIIVEGLKVRETREPGLDRELLADALHEFIPLLLK